MTQTADAIVTGFVKSPMLLERSLAPLRALKQEGTLREIICVTWDSSGIDPFVAPLERMPDIRLVRVPQPDVEGSPNQRGVTYQVRNLDEALSQVDGEDALILKTRPDVVADADLLREKITNFDTLCAVPPDRSALGVAMPKPVLRNKIWIPWADATQPFFFEDAMFLGRKRDLRKLVTKLSPEDLEILADPLCGWFAHIVRYARIFTGSYPLFARYLRDYRYFINKMEYRRELIAKMLSDGFFWHLLIAHAWIMHSQFHVDIGEQGDLSFYANNVNQNADWSDVASLRVASPYDAADTWRAGTKPGHVLPCVKRPYGRLMDDAWQTGVFTGTAPDMPRQTLVRLLTNIAGYSDGRLRDIENDFYRGVAAVYANHRQPAQEILRSA